MTRGLHKDTEVQRGARSDASKEAIARGYEAKDAPPRSVALGLAAFLALMFVGLGVAGLLVERLNDTHLPSAGAASRVTQLPPSPRLLAQPELERQAIESAARRRLSKSAEPIDQAMAQVVRDGWGDEGANQTGDAKTDAGSEQ